MSLSDRTQRGSCGTEAWSRGIRSSSTSESWVVQEVGADEAPLFFWGRVERGIAEMGRDGIMVVVTPFTLDRC